MFEAERAPFKYLVQCRRLWWFVAILPCVLGFSEGRVWTHQRALLTWSVSTAWAAGRLLVRYLSPCVPTGVHASAIKAAPDCWQITHHPWRQELPLLVGKAPSHCLR
jgi:hypothetical protein